MKTRLIVLNVLVAGMGLLLAPHISSAWTYTPASNQDFVKQPQLSADGKGMVVLSDVLKKTYDQVLYFDTAKNKPVWTYSPDKMVNAVDISGNGQYIAAVGAKVTLLRKTSGRPLWSKQYGVSVFDSVALTPNGGYIVAGDRSSNVKLFFNAQPAVNKNWNLGSEDGVASLDISSDGKYILAGTHLSVNFIRLDKTRPIWKYRTRKHVNEAKMSADGKYAVATDQDTVYFFNTSRGTPVWTKTFKDLYAPNVQIADNGSIVAVSTTKVATAFSSTGKQLWSYDLPSGLKGELALSGNGKYAAVGQGSQYVYVFDNAYGSGNRPFRFFKANRPRYVELDQIGDYLAYGKYDLTAATPWPGILADQQSVPVYYDGATLKIRLFGSNPGAAKNNLKVRVAMSLPQINWWDATSSQKEAQSQKPNTRSKALQYTAEALPGYKIIYDEPFPIGKNSSRDNTLSINVPSLLFPQWLSDTLTLLNNVLPFDDLMGDWSGSLEKLVGKDQANQTITDTNRQFVNKNVIFPMLGLGTVQLYDDATGAVYDVDSFYFVYGLSG